MKNGQSSSYRVNVRIGKPLDVLSLKGSSLQQFKTETDHIQSTRSSLFSGSELEPVAFCPICCSPSEESVFLVSVYGASYYQCTQCHHCYLASRPKKSVLDSFYNRDIRYATTYIDQKTLQTRLEQVALPKVDWMISEYESSYGRKPSSILDVGAGGGHFVYAARERGLQASGIEPNIHDREFCRANFGLELSGDDFVEYSKKTPPVDIVCFWGVLEHVADPLKLLKYAYSILQGHDTMVIASSPNWNSLSTTVQKVFPHNIVRHLDPLGHLHLFTESSLATAFELSGFAPISAWYFGMDAYELLMQMHCYFHQDYESTDTQFLSYIQERIDRAMLSDSIVLAGKPLMLANAEKYSVGQ